MREVILTSAFKKDYKRLSCSGHYIMLNLQEVTANTSMM
jgi:mRNA-degrading endonuclease YafQ of YafQ-DinJ toxin-antitoxin module